MVKKKNLTIIDGTSLIYSACYNTSVNNDKTDNFFYYKQTLDHYINSILEDSEANEYIIFGDSTSSYRKRLFDTFKADRVVKKQHIKFKNDLIQYAIEQWGLFINNDLESDDMCLLTHNMYKDGYNVTIASKDSDLRQYPAKFLNYGAYKSGDKSLLFENITEDNAKFNLWKSVLQKGHNNKIDYLEGCGEVCAEKYLKVFKPSQYPYAVLKAYIDGIPKQDGIRKEIKGYGYNKGIDKFNNSFRQTYLFRNNFELDELGISFGVPEFKTFNTGLDGETETF
jgi:5'-3' exonuclease